MTKNQARSKSQKSVKTNEAAVSEVIAVKRLLSTVPEQHNFFVADGTKICNVPQLIEALGAMHEDTFKFHANEDKNDFSNWLRDMFGEEELAESLKTVGTKTEAQLIIAKKLLKELL